MVLGSGYRRSGSPLSKTRSGVVRDLKHMINVDMLDWDSFNGWVQHVRRLGVGLKVYVKVISLLNMDTYMGLNLNIYVGIPTRAGKIEGFAFSDFYKVSDKGFEHNIGYDGRITNMSEFKYYISHDLDEECENWRLAGAEEFNGLLDMLSVGFPAGYNIGKRK